MDLEPAPRGGFVGRVPLALLGLELALRLAMPDRWREIDAGGLSVRSPEYGWTLRPGFQGSAFGAPTTVNRLGYRGIPHSHPRTRRPRVVMVGDSIGFGYRVGDVEVFSALLEQDGGPEVVNLSVPGFGTDQELLRLRAEGMRYRPDAVVVHVCLANDFDDDASGRADGVPKPVFGLEGDELRLLHSPRDASIADQAALWLRERSLAFHWARGLAPARRRMPTPEQEAGEVRLTIRLLEEMGKLCAAHGVTLLALLHPGQFDFDQPPPRRTRKLLREPPNVVLRDLREIYGGDAAVHARFALDPTGHLNAQGHRQLAAELRRWLDPLPARR